jgi:hypothetical protein
MSMDLYVWKAPVVTDPDEAQQLLSLGDESVFEASDDVTRFVTDLAALLPPLEALSETQLHGGGTPWAASPDASARLVALSLRWSAADEDLDTIVELARKYDLVLYDPQGPSFHSPVTPDEDEPYSPGLGEFARGALLVLVGAALAVGAWEVSIPILRWVLVVVGAFVVLVALIALWGTAEQTRRASRSR